MHDCCMRRVECPLMHADVTELADKMTGSLCRRAVRRRVVPFAFDSRGFCIACSALSTDGQSAIVCEDPGNT